MSQNFSNGPDWIFGLHSKVHFYGSKWGFQFIYLVRFMFFSAPRRRSSSTQGCSIVSIAWNWIWSALEPRQSLMAKSSRPAQVQAEIVVNWEICIHFVSRDFKGPTESSVILRFVNAKGIQDTQEMSKAICLCLCLSTRQDLCPLWWQTLQLTLWKCKKCENMKMWKFEFVPSCVALSAALSLFLPLPNFPRKCILFITQFGDLYAQPQLWATWKRLNSGLRATDYGLRTPER